MNRLEPNALLALSTGVALILLIMTALSFIPAFVMLMTSFTRIIIVFSILRQALGLSYRLQAVPYPLLHSLAGGMELWASLSGKEPMLTRYSVAAVHFDMTLSQTRAIEELGGDRGRGPVYQTRPPGAVS